MWCLILQVKPWDSIHLCIYCSYSLCFFSFCTISMPWGFESGKSNILFIAWKITFFLTENNSVHSSACVKMLAAWKMLRGSILTSLWSYLYSPWAPWISLLKAFLIHLGNNWDQLEAVSSEAAFPVVELPLTNCQSSSDRQREDGFEGYKSSTVRLNYKVEELWLSIWNMVWMMGCSIYKWLVVRILEMERRMGLNYSTRVEWNVWQGIKLKNQGWPRW